MNALEEGFEARDRGQARETCPYAKGTQEYKDWQEGWSERQLDAFEI